MSKTKSQQHRTRTVTKSKSIFAANGENSLETQGNSSSQPPAASRKRKYIISALALGLLLSFAVLAAATSGLVATKELTGDDAVENKSNASWLSGIFTRSPEAIPTPILDRQHIYAGGKLIAVETNGTQPTTGVTASDLVVWRLSTGTWYVRDSTDGTTIGAQFGASTDKPVPADFDGDGLADFCVFRPDYPAAGNGTFFIQNNGSGATSGVQWGNSTDIPAVADYDGDGRADVAVWRSSNATFYIRLSSSGELHTVVLGQSDSKPIPADYDGDGLADPAVYRLQTASPFYYDWTIKRTSNGQTETVSYGDQPQGDKPVTGDFDGNGTFDIATRRDGTNQWLVRNVSALSLSISGFTMQASDITVAGDYDGDGKTDAAVWRPSNGTWYIRQSSREGLPDQMRVEAWGQTGDVPVPAAMKR
jgi:hypothetical protein